MPGGTSGARPENYNIGALRPTMTTAGENSHMYAAWKLNVIIDGLLAHRRQP